MKSDARRMDGEQELTAAQEPTIDPNRLIPSAQLTPVARAAVV
jgi:hypothetical protein